MKFRFSRRSGIGCRSRLSRGRPRAGRRRIGVGVASRRPGAAAVTTGTGVGRPRRSSGKTSSTPWVFVATTTLRPSGVSTTCDGAARNGGVAGFPRPRLRVESSSGFRLP